MPGGTRHVLCCAAALSVLCCASAGPLVVTAAGAVRQLTTDSSNEFDGRYKRFFELVHVENSCPKTIVQSDAFVAGGKVTIPHSSIMEDGATCTGTSNMTLTKHGVESRERINARWSQVLRNSGVASIFVQVLDSLRVYWDGAEPSGRSCGNYKYASGVSVLFTSEAEPFASTFSVKAPAGTKFMILGGPNMLCVYIAPLSGDSNDIKVGDETVLVDKAPVTLPPPYTTRDVGTSATPAYFKGEAVTTAAPVRTARAVVATKRPASTKQPPAAVAKPTAAPFSSPGTILSVIAHAGGAFDSLVKLTTFTDVGAYLDETAGKHTLFAPSDEAFKQTAADFGYGGADETEACMHMIDVCAKVADGDPTPVLRRLLMYHIVVGEVHSKQLLAEPWVAAASGDLIKRDSKYPYDLVDMSPKVVDSQLLPKKLDIKCGSGVIHMIDRVMLPLDLDPAALAKVPVPAYDRHKFIDGIGGIRGKDYSGGAGSAGSTDGAGSTGAKGATSGAGTASTATPASGSAEAGPGAGHGSSAGTSGAGDKGATGGTATTTTTDPAPGPARGGSGNRDGASVDAGGEVDGTGAASGTATPSAAAPVTGAAGGESSSRDGSSAGPGVGEDGAGTTSGLGGGNTAAPATAPAGGGSSGRDGPSVGTAAGNGNGGASGTSTTATATTTSAAVPESGHADDSSANRDRPSAGTSTDTSTGSGSGGGIAGSGGGDGSGSSLPVGSAGEDAVGKNATSTPAADPTPAASPSPAESPLPSEPATPIPAPAGTLPASLVANATYGKVPSNGATGSPAASPTPAPDSASTCFPAHALVSLLGGGVVRMADLAVGHRVHVGGGEHSEVYAFTHADAGATSLFVRLDTASGPLTATPTHYVYVDGALRPAGSVAVGDRLNRADGTVAAVVGVSLERHRGLFNPQTLHGDIAVDGFRTSTYTTAVAPSVASVLLAPVRALYRIGAPRRLLSLRHGGGRAAEWAASA